MGVRIGPCTEEEAGYLSEKYWAMLEPVLQTEEGAEEEILVFKAADPKGNLVGGCVLDIDGTKTAEFNSLWVDERFRRQEIGTALVREAERAAAKRGCRSIENNYTFDFQNAKPLFEKLGYREYGVIKGWPEGHDGYLLAKEAGLPPEEDRFSGKVRGNGIAIARGSEEDGEVIGKKLEEYNTAFVPRAHPYLELDRKIKDETARVLGGLVAGVSGWHALHIDLLWTDEPEGSWELAAYLLEETEREAKANGASLALTGTESQFAPLYLGHGYRVCGTRRDERRGYEWRILAKTL